MPKMLPLLQGQPRTHVFFKNQTFRDIQFSL
jgi:hypothetical protein